MVHTKLSLIFLIATVATALSMSINFHNQIIFHNSYSGKHNHKDLPEVLQQKKYQSSEEKISSESVVLENETAEEVPEGKKSDEEEVEKKESDEEEVEKKESDEEEVEKKESDEEEVEKKESEEEEEVEKKESDEEVEKKESDEEVEKKESEEENVEKKESEEEEVEKKESVEEEEKKKSDEEEEKKESDEEEEEKKESDEEEEKKKESDEVVKKESDEVVKKESDEEEKKKSDEEKEEKKELDELEEIAEKYAKLHLKDFYDEQDTGIFGDDYEEIYRKRRSNFQKGTFSGKYYDSYFVREPASASRGYDFTKSFYTPNKEIVYIKATDNSKSKHGSSVQLTNGGPGYPEAKLRFSSAPGQTIDYKVEVYTKDKKY